MLSVENIGDWLLKELEKRGWSQSDLVKESGISRGTLSNIISGTRGVGPESLVAISQALNISPVTVFRKAGLLPEGGEETAFSDWKFLLDQLPQDEQDELRQIALVKIEKRKKDSGVKALKPKKAG
jgi:transcriptional regulator with XRE-family HTH domain